MTAFAAAADGGGVQWVGIVLSIVGVLGGAGGITAIATVVFQRHKFKADTADVLTDTALTLVAPLRARVTELEEQAATIRGRTEATNVEMSELRDSMRELRLIIQQWRSAALQPEATLEQLRAVITRLTKESPA